MGHVGVGAEPGFHGEDSGPRGWGSRGQRCGGCVQVGRLGPSSSLLPGCGECEVGGRELLQLAEGGGLEVMGASVCL